MKKMARGLVVLFSLLSVGLFCHSSSEEVTKCIDGPYHKDKPSPEGPDYVECYSWRDKSCCTADFTAELQRNRVEVLYNFSWNHCKNLSQVRFTIRDTFWFLTEVLRWRPELTQLNNTIAHVYRAGDLISALIAYTYTTTAR